ncbi:MAG: type IV pilus modification PilV family protein [Planctomycetota bacterium]
MRRRPTRASRQAGLSYLEVSLGMVILTLCILPAARFLPVLLDGQRQLETRAQLSFIAQARLEEALSDLAVNFIATDETGDLAAEGHPDWRWHIVVTVPSTGGGRYAAVRSETWHDADGDGSLDPDEPSVRFDTLQANLEWTP